LINAHRFLIAGLLAALTTLSYGQDMPGRAAQGPEAPGREAQGQGTAGPAERRFDGCPSDRIAAAFDDVARGGVLDPGLRRWIFDPRAQAIEPYQVFDDVWQVGVCWVAAYAIRTPEGVVLIDTVHEPHVATWLGNLRKVGIDPAEVRLVLITHGHFDHAGGAYRLKPLAPKARFVMTQRGWNEAAESAAVSAGTPGAWQMIERDVVAKDGERFTVGDVPFTVYETPGHTMGTASYSYPVRDGGHTYRAITIGGLGLNAIESSAQVAAYIASIERIEAMTARSTDPVTVHLTTHAFSNGQTERALLNRQRPPGVVNVLVDPTGLRNQLETLRMAAQLRLVKEKAAGR